MSLSLLLYLIAAILLALEAFAVRPPLVNLGWLGLAIIAFTALVLPAI